ncbi:MAG: TRAM domain-containing protein, partial [Pyrinomonadaceae bacterium]
VPGIAIRTTFITGFPGETEADFEELCSFVRNVEFDRVGVFTYSDEESIPACDLSDKVKRHVAERRKEKLMKEQARISKQRNQRLVGATVPVLFEGESTETELLWQGRMQTQAPEIDGYVLINDNMTDKQPVAGDFVNVKITAAYEYDLLGRIV